MPLSADTLLADLTDAQRDAVRHKDGPLLVLAGPGSGKTTVVTRRIAALVGDGVPAWRILALTFTNKAAGEMRDRAQALLPPEVLDDGGPTVTTFHSFCARRLRRYAAAAGLSSSYTIYDEADRREAIKQAIADAELNTKNWTPASVGSTISNAKNRLVGAEAFAAEAHDFHTRTVARIYRAYERIMRANDALDFDDLLLEMAGLLRKDQGVREELQRRYHYLLIDEYQDTNHAQFVIAHTLAAGHGNICVVGDPDQSIYGWRGADINNILEFEEHYPSARIVPLGENFRSCGYIVDAAAGLIGNNRHRKHKKLYTRLAAGDKPTVTVCRSEQHEAALVADHLRETHEQLGIAWKEMAVLYRVNALSRVLEEAMRQQRIPYVIARGTAFYERKEVRDALAYLRLVVNPNDEVSLRRVVNTPTRGIGATTLKKIEVFAVDRQLRLFEAMRQAAAGAVDGLSTRSAAAVGRFTTLIDELRAAAEDPPQVFAATGGDALAGLVEQVIRASGLEGMYRKDTDEDRQRLENLGELISAAAQFDPGDVLDGQDPSRRDLLSLFIESVALVSDQDAIDAESGTVTLMSLHAAKGLEYDTVVIVGLEENLLPMLRMTQTELELEEERRLCFVGMTRAKRRLLLTRAAVRTHRGVRAGTIASRFLSELPGDSIVHCDQAGDIFDEDVPVGAGARYGADERLLDAFPVGCIVRHPKFGLGRVEEVTPRARGGSARVRFPVAGLKTLILEHAPLVRVG